MQVPNRGQVKKGEKPWLKGIFLVFVWLLILSLVKDFSQTRKGFGRVKESEVRLEEAKRKNIELTAKLSNVQSVQYKEKLIRDKLNMQKDDEVVVVLPGVSSQVISQKNVEKSEKNWEKWQKVLGLN